jgi:hypothetical protein
MCGTGFTSDGAGACDATLPAADCPAGQMAVPGDTTCKNVGAADAPACARGSIAVPGDATCRPIADCGSAPWGAIAVDASTVYVDASYAGGASDGSAAHPFTTIGAALKVAAAGGVVAVAAGSYAESVAPTVAVKLWGRCPSMTEIAAPGTGAPAITLGAATSSSEVHAMALTGGGAGASVQGANGITFDRVWVHDTAGVGIDSSGSITVGDSVVELTHTVGVRVEGGTASLSRSVVRDVGADPNGGALGNGIAAVSGATVDVATTVVERTLDEAINASAASLSVTGSVVRDTGVEVSTQIRGWGVVISSSAPGGAPSTLKLSGSLVERNREYGVYIGGHVTATVDDTLVTGTLERSDGTRGSGLQAQSVGGIQASATITRSLFEKNFFNGVSSVGSQIIVRNCVVRDNRAEASTQQGDGIAVSYSDDQSAKASLEVHGSLVERNEGDAISIQSSTAIVESTLIRDTKPVITTSADGVGIFVARNAADAPRSSVQVQASVVRNANGTGIALSGADVTIEGTVVRDTRMVTVGAQSFGDGVVAYPDANYPSTATLAMTSCLVAGNDSTGVFVQTGTATIDKTHVTGTAVDASGGFGDGVATVETGSTTLTGSLVDGCARAGVSTFGSALSIGGSAIVCNGIALDGEPGPATGTPYSVDVLASNDCGCDPTRTACQVLSSSLAAPTAVGRYH